MLNQQKRLSYGLLLAGTLLLVSLLNSGEERKTLVEGYVRNNSTGVSGALVRLRGTEHWAVTEADGRFKLAIPASETTPHLTAWAPGYYITDSSEAPFILTLKSHPRADNADYAFISPTLDLQNPAACANCHKDRGQEISMPVEEWLADAHAGAATNPRFLSLYNGTALDGRRGSLTLFDFDPTSGIDIPRAPSLGQDKVGAGFRLDFPDQSGACALCHVPVLALTSPYNADPNLASGTAQQGISCDFCHKIWNVRLGKGGLPSPNQPGILSLEFLRPAEDQQVFVGPFQDTPGDDIYSALQNQSQFCAACHFGEFWGVRIYNSFGEWLASPYSDPQTGKTCQDCHMPHSGATTFAQVPDTAKFVPQRDPYTIFSHLMPGARDMTLLENTATISLDAQRESDGLRVTVRVTNSGAGHDIPTDNPLRNMILLLTVTDSAGNKLALIEGSTIPLWGGVGDPEEGYYAGEAGVLYAKILADFYTGESPTYAYWRQTRFVSDNRIPAFATDETHYSFSLPPDGEPITIDARLILRRAFIELMDQKGWDTPDLMMAHETVQLK